jgi:universal stress protein E
MSDIILAVIELDNFPKHVAARATWLAKIYGYELFLMLSDPTATVLGESFVVSNEARDVAERIKETQLQIIGELAADAESQGITVRTDVVDERPAGDAIIAHANEIEPRFVVKGTQYHSAASRALFADIDWQLIRQLDYPLWLVKEDSWDAQPKIIAAVDPTHSGDEKAALDQQILAAAASIAAESGGTVDLLHTYQRLVEIGSKAMWTFKPVRLPVDELSEKIRGEHRALLDKLADEIGIPAERVHQLPGRADEILPAFARSNGANLVVMGALARSGLKRRVLGSTAERVLDHLPCDVLIVRTA